MVFARAGKCICDKYKDELLNVMTPPTTYPKINEKGDQMINLHHTNIHAATPQFDDGLLSVWVNIRFNAAISFQYTAC